VTPIRSPRARAPIAALVLLVGALLLLAAPAAGQDPPPGTPPPALDDARAMAIADGDARIRRWISDKRITRTVAERDAATDRWTAWYMSEAHVLPVPNPWLLQIGPS
jgi:hypothetical protein